VSVCGFDVAALCLGNASRSRPDDYIEAIVKAGSPILCRLGESIEHTP